MDERHIRQLLRRMAGGEPVAAGAGTFGQAFAPLVFYARQFGYTYTDITAGRRQMLIQFVPDPTPQARARAAENRARYPDAATGGELPPPDPDAMALIKAQGYFAMDLPISEGMKIGLSVLLVSFVSMALVGRFGLGIGAAVWAGALALVAVGAFFNRRSRARNSALLEAAGFTLTTDPMGRRRYLPPADPPD
ncbi:hypothetical protein QF037_003321 [Streptomyces canus]|uniref:hypothetical protein n=1 Tax=Streptomyces canus TaxID=58343 RepID=UPI002782CAEF|nr:hypothetical protein [Streptomyces canus]MDQ0598976.1 hypothetical protein [Streptomyces canus]